MSARLPCEILGKDVIEAGLCTRCGSCAGVCHLDNIRMADRTGSCLPEYGARCDSCGLCLECCPGAKVDFRSLEKMLFGEVPADPYIGAARKAWIAHAADEGTRNAGASGGVVTGLLLGMLDNRAIDGALLFGMDESRPYLGKGTLARTAPEISAAAQSKYQLSPMNERLSELASAEGLFSVCGLPCHVHAIRKLQKAGWEGSSHIGPVIGIYCGNNLYFEATRIMLRKLGVRSLEDVDRMSYREGDWPGEFSVTTRDGNRASVSKLDFNQAIPFFINRRCLFCTDLTNELSDISVGDGWSKEGKGRGGWSVVIARTAEGERIVEEAIGEGSIVAQETGLEELVPMHSHAFDLKKPGAWTRIGSWKRLGFKVPEYTGQPVKAGPGRRFLEFFISTQFLVLGSVAGRAAFRVIPSRALGPFFRWLRKTWMTLTRKK